MTEILSILISAGALLLTVFLEWPRIKKRIAGSKKSNIADIEEAQTTTAVSSDSKNQSANLQKHKSSFAKTAVSILVAIVYGFLFGGIFIPSGELITGIAAIIFWSLSIFWAIRYIRYNSWSFILKSLVLGIVGFLIVTVILGVSGHIA
jgi:hypothetical protein